MPSEARQKKIMEKLNRAQKCSILGPQNLGSGGPGPPGPPPGSAPELCINICYDIFLEQVCCELNLGGNKRMLVIKGLFTQCDNICDNVKFLLMQVMGSMATNGSVHTDTCISDFYCDLDISGEVIIWPCRWRTVWMVLKKSCQL